MNNNKLLYVYALLAVICWSTIGSAIEISLRYVNFIQLLLFSSFITIIVLFVILITQNKLSLLKELKPPDFFKSAIYGLLNPFAYYFVLFKAYDLLQAQEAVVLNYTWPIALVLLSIPVLGQKIGFKSIAALFISFFGIIIVVTGGNVDNLELSNKFGVVLALGSSIIWALYWILNMRDKREAVSKLLLNFIFGFIYVLIASAITGNLKTIPMEGVIGVTYIGLFEMGITFVLWLKALKLAPTTARVSNLIYISPFLSLVFIFIFVGEKIMQTSWIGLIFIVSGIILQQVSSRAKK